MALPEALDVGRGIGQFPGAAVPWVGVDQRDTEAQDVPHIPHRPCEVGVVGHDDGLLVLSVESVHQETGSFAKARCSAVPPLDDLDELVRQVVEVARRRLT